MAEFDPRAYWESRLRSQYSLHGVGYQGLGVPFNQWLYRVRRHVFKRFIRRLGLDVSSAEILDIGSGTGFYIERWMELGASRVSGSDLTEVAVENLRRLFPRSSFFRLDISTDAPLPPVGPFDVVSIIDVLFHIVDDRRYAQAFRNAASLLRPGGLLLISENFLPGYRLPSLHMVNRPAAEIEDCLRRAGFEQIRRQPVFVAMGYPVGTRRRLPALLWRVMTLPVSANRRIGIVTGFLLGAVLYPLEICLTRLVKQGPSTNYGAYRKVTGSGSWTP